MSNRFDRYIKGEPAVPSTETADLAGRPAPPEGHTYLYTEFEVELTRLINRHSADNDSGTPDYILANYLVDCLKGFNKVVKRRAEWRGEHTELPALHDIQRGVRTVPMVVTSPNGRMMNEIGEAKITYSPGEQVPPIGRIERVVAVFEPEPDE